MLSRWQKTIVDQQGNVQPNAIIIVRRESDQTLAAVYKDRDGQEMYPMGQVVADEVGFVHFYVPAGLYRITSISPAIDWRDVDIGGSNAAALAEDARILADNAMQNSTSASSAAQTAAENASEALRIANEALRIANEAGSVWR